jgi:hypothetical protein
VTQTPATPLFERDQQPLLRLDSSFLQGVLSPKKLNEVKKKYRLPSQPIHTNRSLTIEDKMSPPQTGKRSHDHLVEPARLVTMKMSFDVLSTVSFQAKPMAQKIQVTNGSGLTIRY